MGSKPWIERATRNLLSSEKYLAGEEFLIQRNGRSVKGTIEIGRTPSGQSIFIGDNITIRLDQQTVIDGVPAPDWKWNR